MKNLMMIMMVFCCIFSCDDIDNLDRIEGMGPIVEEKLAFEDFTGIELDAPFRVNLEQGDSYEVLVEGHQNIIDRLRTKIVNDRLEIGLANGNYRSFELEFFITMPELNYIAIDGAGKLEIDEFTMEELRCHIDGAGELNFNAKLDITSDLRIDIDGAADTYFQEINAQNVVVHVDGKGDLTLRGTTTDLDISIDGMGDIEAFALDSKNVKVVVDGLGKTEVTAEEELDVEIDGIGNVYYKGDPTIYKEIDGLGRLFDAN